MARIEQSIEVNVPVRTAYDQLTQFEHYPRFMEEVEQVRQLDDTHLHLRAKGGTANLEWDAEITQQVPDQCIAWRNTNGPHYAGKVELQPLAQDKTRIMLTIECEQGEQLLPQHGNAESVLAQRAEHDLARFKKFMENLGHETGAWRGQVRDAQPIAAGGAQQKQKQSGKEAGKPAGAGQQAQQAQQAQPGQQTPPSRQADGGDERQSWFPNLLQVWDEPLNMMRKMSEEMDQLVGKFMGRAGPAALYDKVRQSAAPSTTWAPAVEVAQGADKLVICAELPGVRREDVRVEIKNDRVTIEGERHPAQQPQELRRTERNYGHFYRVIALPEGAEPDAASAALHDGVLEITVPVPEGGKRARRIDIRAQ